MPAFHEAFADIIALFQHFTFPEALKSQIRKTRGDLFPQNLLGELAVQFGQAANGGFDALRSAIGSYQPVDGTRPAPRATRRENGCAPSPKPRTIIPTKSRTNSVRCWCQRFSPPFHRSIRRAWQISFDLPRGGPAYCRPARFPMTLPTGWRKRRRRRPARSSPCAFGRWIIVRPPISLSRIICAL